MPPAPTRKSSNNTLAAELFHKEKLRKYIKETKNTEEKRLLVQN